MISLIKWSFCSRSPSKFVVRLFPHISVILGSIYANLQNFAPPRLSHVILFDSLFWQRIRIAIKMTSRVDSKCNFLFTSHLPRMDINWKKNKEHICLIVIYITCIVSFILYMLLFVYKFTHNYSRYKLIIIQLINNQFIWLHKQKSIRWNRVNSDSFSKPQSVIPYLYIKKSNPNSPLHSHGTHLK